MNVLDLVRPELRALKGYSSARLEAGQAAVMLNANEASHALVPSPGSSPLHRYPEPQPAALLAALAGFYGVQDAQVLVGRGSDEAIDLLVRACCRAGQDRILICPPTFGMYEVCAAVQGAGIVRVPLRGDAGFAPDEEAIGAALADPALSIRIVFVCAPNNPTGSAVPRGVIERLLAVSRGRALLVVDEAYVEFAESPSLAAELDQWPNLVVLRTLSKAFGLAGARIGSLLAAPELVAQLKRIMAPYPVPAPCSDLALAALAQQQAVTGWVVQSRAERSRMQAALASLGGVLRVWPSQANFLCFRVADATATWSALAARGVLVRNIGHYPQLKHCLRVSIGTPAENERFLAALRDVLGSLP